MVNLKEKIRAEVRKELEVMERRYGTMASILRALGVTVEGGPCPLSHQVLLHIPALFPTIMILVCSFCA